MVVIKAQLKRIFKQLLGITLEDVASLKDGLLVWANGWEFGFVELFEPQPGRVAEKKHVVGFGEGHFGICGSGLVGIIAVCSLFLKFYWQVLFFQSYIQHIWIFLAD